MNETLHAVPTYRNTVAFKTFLQGFYFTHNNLNVEALVSNPETFYFLVGVVSFSFDGDQFQIVPQVPFFILLEAQN
jgi:hypothetical protein